VPARGQPTLDDNSRCRRTGLAIRRPPPGVALTGITAGAWPSRLRHRAPGELLAMRSRRPGSNGARRRDPQLIPNSVLTLIANVTIALTAPARIVRGSL